MPACLSYSTSDLIYVINQPLQGGFPTPTTTGGAITQYSIACVSQTSSGAACEYPDGLPTGLTFNTYNGTIPTNSTSGLGVPTVAMLKTTYTVTGANSGGKISTDITIVVSSNPVDGVTYANTKYPTFTLRYNQMVFYKPHIPAKVLEGGAVLDFTLQSGTALFPAGVTFIPGKGSYQGWISGQPTVLQYPHQVTNIRISSTTTSTTETISASVMVLDMAPVAGSLKYPTNELVNPVYDDGEVYTYTWKLATTAELTPTVQGPLLGLKSCKISPDLTAKTGLTFNGVTCAIHGTPSILAPTTVTYTVTAGNVGNPTVSTTIKIRVDATPPSDLQYSAGLKTFIVGKYSSPSEFPTVSYAGDPVTQYSISPTTLPPGLIFDATNATVYGNATTVQATALTFTVTAANSGGSDTASFTIRVVATAPSGLAYNGQVAALVTLRKGVAIAPALTPSWDASTLVGDAQLSYKISPSLPSGLAMSSKTGVISGTTSVLTYPATNFTIIATDSGGNSTAYVAIAILDQAVSDLMFPTTDPYPIYTPDLYYKYTINRGVPLGGDLVPSKKGECAPS